MVVLGIDPGLAKTGWGVIRTIDRVSSYVDSGLIRTLTTDAHTDRLCTISDGLKRVVARIKPDLICVERVFINVNLKSSLLLSEARGAIIVALSPHKSPLIELSALQIKQYVTGKGRADKQLVASMVRRLLMNMPSGLVSDCTDALACALSAQALHANAMPYRPRKRRLLRHLKVPR